MASISTNGTIAHPALDRPKGYGSFITVTILFFVWGFITCMNDLLIPKFKADFSLSQFQANLVQSAFFGAYFLVSLLYFLVSAIFGDPINRIGYKNGIVLGLATSGVGCLVFYPAASFLSYPLFLAGLLILGGGVTLIQIAANPYVAILGPEDSAPSRLNLSQGINSLGYVIAPLVGGLLLFGSQVYSGASSGPKAVQAPYLGLAVVFFILAGVFKVIHLPNYSNHEKVKPGIHVFRHPHFVWGWLAIFFYVGSEVTVGSIIINYLGDKDVLGLASHDADKYLSFYWGGLMIGRLMGAVALGSMQSLRKYSLMAVLAVGSVLVIFLNATFKEKLTRGHFLDPIDVLPFVIMVALSFAAFAVGRSKPGRMIGLFGICAIILTIFSMTTHGSLALWSIIGIGLFNSIMWSNIFTLSIRGLDEDTSQGSSLLVMMIVGGAVMPAIQGALMDVVGVRLSLAVVLLGYAYLVFFGFVGCKKSRNPRPVPEGGVA